jgi:hypothetical protein
MNCWAIASASSVPCLMGLDRQRDREVAFAGAAQCEEADVTVLVGPGELREAQDEWPFGAGLSSEV